MKLTSSDQNPPTDFRQCRQQKGTIPLEEINADPRVCIKRHLMIASTLLYLHVQLDHATKRRPNLVHIGPRQLVVIRDPDYFIMGQHR